MATNSSDVRSENADFGRLIRLGMRVERVEIEKGAEWSFQASPWPRIMKGAGLALLCFVGSRVVSGYQWIGVGVVFAWALWMLLCVPHARLTMRPHDCILSKGALLIGLVPLRLPGKNITARDVEVYQTSLRTNSRIVLALQTSTTRVKVWTFPMWLNAAKMREETERAVRRAAVLLRRDLRNAGELPNT